MNWLKDKMKGRYGGDQLSMALLILSIVLTLLGQWASLQVLMVLSYVPLALTLYRMFSKDIDKRRMENYKFAILMSPIYKKYHGFKTKRKNRKAYKYLKCPSCKKKLRVPRGKKKITVTCPHCKEKFNTKT